MSGAAPRARATRMEDVIAFAGAQIDIARFYPEDEAYLVERELTVGHYDVL